MHFIQGLKTKSPNATQFPEIKITYPDDLGNSGYTSSEINELFRTHSLNIVGYLFTIHLFDSEDIVSVVIKKSIK